MSRRRLIFYVVIFIATVCLGIWMDNGNSHQGVSGLRKGDRVRVTTNTFATREYSTHSELRKAIIHEDRMSLLQYLYDEKARSVLPGTEGRVIMSAGSCVEVCFDDDPLRNWYVELDFIERAK